MDFILSHAKEIMYLCFGVGFLVLVGFACRSLYIATRVLKKMDDLSDLFIEYVQRPLQMFLQIKKFVSTIQGFFKKEK